MKQAFVILLGIVLLSSCNSTRQRKLHHVEITVIENSSGVTGFSVVKFDNTNYVIDSVYYESPHVLDTAALNKAMEGIPKETPIAIKTTSHE